MKRESITRSYRRAIAWRPYTLWWHAFGWIFFANLAMSSTAMTGAIIIVTPFDTPTYNILLYIVYFIILWVLSMSGVLSITGLDTIARGKMTLGEWEEHLRSNIQSNQRRARTSNPVAVAIMVCHASYHGVRYVLLGLRYCVIHSPKAIGAIGSGLKIVAKALHK